MAYSLQIKGRHTLEIKQQVDKFKKLNFLICFNVQVIQFKKIYTILYKREWCLALY